MAWHFYFNLTSTSPDHNIHESTNTATRTQGTTMAVPTNTMTGIATGNYQARRVALPLNHDVSVAAPPEKMEPSEDDAIQVLLDKTAQLKLSNTQLKLTNTQLENDNKEWKPASTEAGP